MSRSVAPPLADVLERESALRSVRVESRSARSVEVFWWRGPTGCTRRPFMWTGGGRVRARTTVEVGQEVTDVCSRGRPVQGPRPGPASMRWDSRRSSSPTKTTSRADSRSSKGRPAWARPTPCWSLWRSVGSEPWLLLTRRSATSMVSVASTRRRLPSSMTSALPAEHALVLHAQQVHAHSRGRRCQRRRCQRRSDASAVSFFRDR